MKRLQKEDKALVIAGGIGILAVIGSVLSGDPNYAVIGSIVTGIGVMLKGVLK